MSSIDYKNLADEIAAITEGIPHKIANLANISAYLWEKLPDLNWAGFYLMEQGKLVLGPFQGKVACVEIEVGKGVCGTAVQEKRSVRVENVHEFSGHIACDSASNSELVIPLFKEGEVVGVLDLDSPLFSRFTEEDEKGLILIGKQIEKSF